MMKRGVHLVAIAFRLILGAMMVYGGIQKFQKPIPSPIEVVEKAQKFQSSEQESTLQKILYISGAKQTGYFWQVLGICELVFGILLLLQWTGFLGALLLLPITLQIFLFHIFLENEETLELLKTGGLFLMNILLVLKEWKSWKHLIWIKPM